MTSKYLWVNQKCWAGSTFWSMRCTCKAGKQADTQHAAVSRKRKLLQMCLQQSKLKLLSWSCEKETFLMFTQRVFLCQEAIETYLAGGAEGRKNKSLFPPFSMHFSLCAMRLRAKTAFLLLFACIHSNLYQVLFLICFNVT